MAPEGDRVRVTVQDAPVEAVVQEMGEQLGFTVRFARPSTATITGTRRGDTQSVLAWVLAGHDRAIFNEKVGGALRVSRVVVFGQSRTGAEAPPPPPPADAGNLAPDEPPADTTDEPPPDHPDDDSGFGDQPDHGDQPPAN